MLDNRFYYEPILAGHPSDEIDISVQMLDSYFAAPIWVSSMTGGTERAKRINKNLAKACGEYKLGMGLGSCRALLDSNERLEDFDVRDLMGDQPLYANLGVAQIEELIHAGKMNLIEEMIGRLRANGLIVHVNPLQEWLQPEGDRYQMSPIEMIKRLLDHFPGIKLIVKEVGQGMGPRSLETLYDLPIQAVDFAAAGGTNFAKLELHRAEDDVHFRNDDLTRVGHSADEMVGLTNDIVEASERQCKETIISGGVRNFLDGYYYTQKLNSKAIYGQASVFLKHAMGNYEDLQKHIESEINGLKIAHQFLTLK